MLGPVLETSTVTEIALALPSWQVYSVVGEKDLSPGRDNPRWPGIGWTAQRGYGSLEGAPDQACVLGRASWKRGHMS